MAEPGSLEIKTLSIYTLDATGSITDVDDLSDQYLHCMLMQSIFDSSIRLNIVMSESKGSLTRFNKVGFQGQEFVKCVISTIDHRTVDLDFWVENIEGIEFSNKQQSASLVLRCVTKENLISVFQSVNQAFKSTYPKAINSIFKDYIAAPLKTNKMLGPQDFEPPSIVVDEIDDQYAQQFIIPGLQPLSAINWCTGRTFGNSSQERNIGLKNGSNTWVFYQDCDNYQYRNLEYLIGNNKKEAKTLIYGAMDAESDQKKENWDVKIKNLYDIEGMDNKHNSNHGIYANRVRAIDYFKKTYRDIGYNYVNDFGRFETLGKRTVIDKDFADSFVKSNWTELFLKDTTKFGGDNGQAYEHVYGNRRGWYHSLFNMKCKITLEGNLDWKPGEVINMDVPEQSATTVEAGDSVDTKFSGHWFVDTVMHSWSKESHETTLELLKDSVVNATGA